MNKRLTTLLSLTILTGIGLTAWTSFISYKPKRVAQAKQNTLPDAYMEGVKALILNKSGRPSMEIASPKMTHFTQGDITHFTTPKVTIYRESPKPWYINSKFGKATKGIDQVYFWDTVTIQHPADQKSPATLIETESLTVHPAEHTAETIDKVIMTQPSIVINSIGMHADMNSGNIKLLSKAWGEYAPSS